MTKTPRQEFQEVLALDDKAEREKAGIDWFERTHHLLAVQFAIPMLATDAQKEKAFKRALTDLALAAVSTFGAEMRKPDDPHAAALSIEVFGARKELAS